MYALLLWIYGSCISCGVRTIDPDVGGSSDGKDQQEEDEDEGLEVVGCHPLHAIQDGAEELALRGGEE